MDQLAQEDDEDCGDVAVEGNAARHHLAQHQSKGTRFAANMTDMKNTCRLTPLADFPTAHSFFSLSNLDRVLVNPWDDGLKHDK